MRIILGSESPGRKKLLATLGYKFTVIRPNIDEKKIRKQNPKKLVLALASAKATALLTRIRKPAILITADQVVYCNQRIIEKPQNKKEAKEFLRLYAHYSVQTITAIVVTNSSTHQQLSALKTATIWFRPIPKKIIELLIKQSLTLSCAGGFSIDDPLLKSFILKIRGNTDTIIGLPLATTKKLITSLSN